MGSLPNFPSLSPLGQIRQPPWQSSSQNNACGGGQAARGANNWIGDLAPKPLSIMPSLKSFDAIGGQGHSAVANQANCQAPAERKPNTKYAKNQEVTIYSEGSKAWVLAKITAVDIHGTVTVEYGGKQKLVPVENQHTHLRPKSEAPQQSFPSAASSVPIGQPKVDYAASSVYAASMAAQQGTYISAPVANQCAQQFAGANSASVLSPAQAIFQKFGGSNSAAVLQPANAFPQHPGCANLASGAPPGQAGAFQFDLSALCNDAGMR